MALDLTELEDKQKSQLRKPKRSNLKKMDPWDKFEPIKKEPSITKDKTTDIKPPIPEHENTKNPTS